MDVEYHTCQTCGHPYALPDHTCEPIVKMTKPYVQKMVAQRLQKYTTKRIVRSYNDIVKELVSPACTFDRANELIDLLADDWR